MLKGIIKDAFAILSQGYITIGEYGLNVVNLVQENPPSPKAERAIDKLIAMTMIFESIMDHVVLNDAGTAIVNIRFQDVSVINDLLLQLKKQGGFYSLPAYPTPLTMYIFNISVNPESAEEEIGNAEVDSTADPIVLDFEGKKEMVFTFSDPITDDKAIIYANDQNALKYTAIFDMQDGTKELEFESNTKMADSPSRWNPMTKKWNPLGDTGEFKATGDLSGSNWFVNISQSYYL